MSLRKLFLTGALALTVSAAVPAKASADWLFTPFIGGTFGGSADLGSVNESDSDEFNRKLSYGASLAWMGKGIIGFEADFGYSPNFFGTDSDDTVNLVGEGNVTTLMGNLVLGAPLGPVRPYASGGVGLIRTRVDNAGQFFDDVDQSDFGFNIGAGVMGFFTNNIGIRGDVRFFRSLQDVDVDSTNVTLGSFKFWRGSVGVTFKF